MTGFDERQKAFEAKFHLDEELAFKANARRDKLLGLWAAQKLGLSREAAESYAGSIVDSDLKDSRHIAMLAKLTADLAPLGVTAAELQAEMHRLDSIARSQIMGEAGSGRHTVSPS
jgi:hypothetical protein